MESTQQYSSTSSQAHNSSTASDPARKCLISYARKLPRQSHVWVQGIVITIQTPEHSQTKHITIDDGSALAVLQVNPKKHKSLNLANIKPGSYLMATSIWCTRLKGSRLGLTAFTVRDLTANAAFLQTMWNLEVVDSYLHYHEIQQQQQ